MTTVQIIEGMGRIISERCENKPLDDTFVKEISDGINASLNRWHDELIGLEAINEANEIKACTPDNTVEFLKTSALTDLHKFMRWFDKQEILVFDYKRYAELERLEKEECEMA